VLQSQLQDLARCHCEGTELSALASLLSSVKNYQDVAELLTSSAEQRLVRVLLRLGHLDKNGPAVAEIPILSNQVLAEFPDIFGWPGLFFGTVTKNR
jgi:hypothetical protein